MHERYVPSPQLLDYARDVIEPIQAVLLAQLDEHLVAAFLDDDGDEAVFESTMTWFAQAKARQVSTGPLAALIAARAARARVRGLEFAAVAEARKHGISWRDIGHAFGITRQAAQKRWAWIEDVTPDLVFAARH